MRRAAILAAALALAGCAALRPGADEPLASSSPPAPPAAPLPGAGQLRLRCQDGSSISLRLDGDNAWLEGLPAGPQLLLRDAGGVRPQHSVWSNAHLRAEFGLGEDGREALLHPLEPAGPTLHCQAS